MQEYSFRQALETIRNSSPIRSSFISSGNDISLQSSDSTFSSFSSLTNTSSVVSGLDSRASSLANLYTTHHLDGSQNSLTSSQSLIQESENNAALKPEDVAFMSSVLTLGDSRSEEARREQSGNDHAAQQNTSKDPIAGTQENRPRQPSFASSSKVAKPEHLSINPQEIKRISPQEPSSCLSPVLESPTKDAPVHNSFSMPSSFFGSIDSSASVSQLASSIMSHLIQSGAKHSLASFSESTPADGKKEGQSFSYVNGEVANEANKLQFGIRNQQYVDSRVNDNNKGVIDNRDTVNSNGGRNNSPSANLTTSNELGRGTAIGRLHAGKRFIPAPVSTSLPLDASFSSPMQTSPLFIDHARLNHVGSVASANASGDGSSEMFQHPNSAQQHGMFFNPYQALEVANKIANGVPDFATQAMLSAYAAATAAAVNPGLSGAADGSSSIGGVGVGIGSVDGDGVGNSNGSDSTANTSATSMGMLYNIQNVREEGAHKEPREISVNNNNNINQYLSLLPNFANLAGANVESILGGNLGLLGNAQMLGSVFDGGASDVVGSGNDRIITMKNAGHSFGSVGANPHSLSAMIEMEHNFMLVSGFRRKKDTISSQSQQERIFICRFTGCCRRFKRFEHLKRHVRTHTGERPYPCTVPGCFKSFSRSDNLSQHMRVHQELGNAIHGGSSSSAAAAASSASASSSGSSSSSSALINSQSSQQGAIVSSNSSDDSPLRLNLLSASPITTKATTATTTEAAEAAAISSSSASASQSQPYASPVHSILSNSPSPLKVSESESSAPTSAKTLQSAAAATSVSQNFIPNNRNSGSLCAGSGAVSPSSGSLLYKLSSPDSFRNGDQPGGHYASQSVHQSHSDSGRIFGDLTALSNFQLNPLIKPLNVSSHSEVSPTRSHRVSSASQGMSQGFINPQALSPERKATPDANMKKLNFPANLAAALLRKESFAEAASSSHNSSQHLLDRPFEIVAAHPSSSSPSSAASSS